MNKTYLAVLKNNLIRYSRCNLFWLYCLFYLGWLAIVFVNAGVNHTTISGYVVFFSLIFSVMFASGFWQNGWAVGNVDPMTGFPSEKYGNDRQYMVFMTSLPLSRKVHFYLQVLLYLLVAALPCLISLVLHLLAAYAEHGHYGLVLYFHLFFYAFLVFIGGDQTNSDIPMIFKGNIYSWKHPLKIKAILFVAIAMSVVVFWNNLESWLGPDFANQATVYLVSKPFIPALLLLLGAFFSGAEVKGLLKRKSIRKHSCYFTYSNFTSSKWEKRY